MKKILVLAALAFVVAAPIAYAAFERPPVACSLEVSSNFVQKSETAEFRYTSSPTMSSLTITKFVGNPSTGTETVIATTNVVNGGRTITADVSAEYRFKFTGQDGTATCARTVRIPNITGPVR